MQLQECTNCDGAGFVEDPTACDDPGHCYPTMECPDCSGTGWMQDED